MYWSVINKMLQSLANLLDLLEQIVCAVAFGTRPNISYWFRQKLTSTCVTSTCVACIRPYFPLQILWLLHTVAPLNTHITGFWDVSVLNAQTTHLACLSLTLACLLDFRVNMLYNLSRDGTALVPGKRRPDLNNEFSSVHQQSVPFAFSIVYHFRSQGPRRLVAREALVPYRSTFQVMGVTMEQAKPIIVFESIYSGMCVLVLRWDVNYVTGPSVH